MECETNYNPIHESTAPATAPADTTSQSPTPAIPESSDSEALRHIRDFLRAPKPDGITGNEIAYIAQLLTLKAYDHAVTISHATVQQALNAKDERTVRTVERKLVQRGWIATVSRRGKSKETTVNLQRLPLLAPAPKPGAEAHTFLDNYEKWHAQRSFDLEKNGNKPLPRLHKKQRLAALVNAQKILSLEGGDRVLATQKLNLALKTQPQLCKSLTRGMYHVYRKWAAIRKVWDEQHSNTKGENRNGTN